MEMSEKMMCSQVEWEDDEGTILYRLSWAQKTGCQNVGALSYLQTLPLKTRIKRMAKDGHSARAIASKLNQGEGIKISCTSVCNILHGGRKPLRWLRVTHKRVLGEENKIARVDFCGKWMDCRCSQVEWEDDEGTILYRLSWAQKTGCQNVGALSYLQTLPLKTRIKRMAKDGHSARAIASKLNQGEGIKISCTSVCNILHGGRKPLRWLRVTHKRVLGEENKIARVDFCGKWMDCRCSQVEWEDDEGTILYRLSWAQKTGCQNVGALSYLQTLPLKTRIKRMAKDGHSARAIASKLNQGEGIKISCTSVCNILHGGRKPLRWLRVTHKRVLGEENKIARVDFCGKWMDCRCSQVEWEDDEGTILYRLSWAQKTGCQNVGALSYLQTLPLKTRIKRMAKDGHSARAIASKLNQGEGIKISCTSVCNILHGGRKPLRWLRVTHKRVLGEENKIARVDFCGKWMDCRCSQVEWEDDEGTILYRLSWAQKTGCQNVGALSYLQTLPLKTRIKRMAKDGHSARAIASKLNQGEGIKISCTSVCNILHGGRKPLRWLRVTHKRVLGEENKIARVDFCGKWMDCRCSQVEWEDDEGTILYRLSWAQKTGCQNVGALSYLQTLPLKTRIKRMAKDGHSARAIASKLNQGEGIKISCTSVCNILHGGRKPLRWLRVTHKRVLGEENKIARVDFCGKWMDCRCSQVEWEDDEGTILYRLSWAQKTGCQNVGALSYLQTLPLKTRIKRMAKDGHSARAIASKLNQGEGIKISCTSVCNILHGGRKPLRWLRVTHKRVLGEENKIARVDFCGKWMDCRSSTFDSWVFLDAKDLYCYKYDKGRLDFAWQEVDTKEEFC
eukprot:gene11306-biopygen12758